MARRTDCRRYSDGFKATAVRLSELEGTQTQDVARILDIHPFMLSRWKKDWREGRIVAENDRSKLDSEERSELARLRKVEKSYERLQQKHALLKKTIQYISEQKRKSSSTSILKGGSSRLR